MPNTVLKYYKVVNTLPAVLDTDSIYLVKVGTGFDMYVTDHVTGLPVSLNVQAPTGVIANVQAIENIYTMQTNKELITIKKSSAVYLDVTGLKLAANNTIASKDILGLVTSDVTPNSAVLVQVAGLLQVSDPEWFAAHNLGSGTSIGYWWLDSTPGRLTKTAPNGSINPSWSVKVGAGTNNSAILIDIKNSIKL